MRWISEGADEFQVQLETGDPLSVHGGSERGEGLRNPVAGGHKFQHVPVMCR